MRATLGTGPVGTGAYLIEHRGSWLDAHHADVWLLLLFFPLVPLSRWQVTVGSWGEGQPESTSLDVTLQSRCRIPLGAALLRIVRAAGVTALTCLPFGFAVWKVGSPWAAPVLNTLLGSIVAPGLLGKLSMAIELGVVLAGAAIPVLVLMHLDERTPRVSLRSVLWPRKAQ